MTDGYLIDLPIGTEKRGLHLAPPHGELIFQGRKTAIAKARPFDVSGPWILISGGMAYGTMDVALPQPVTAEEFDKRFPEHRVTCNERKRWWPGIDPLYLSHITYFEAFEKPYPITVVSGMQTVVEQVEFKDGQPPCLGDHCDEVRMVLEEVKLAKGQKEHKSPELPDGAVSLAEVISEPLIVEDSSGGETVVTPEPHGVPDVLNIVVSRIHKSFTTAADDLLALGYMTQEQRIALSGAIGDALDRFNEVLEASGLASRLQGMPVDPGHAVMIASKVRTLERAQREDLEDAASAVEGLEAHRAGETVPWEDVKERLLPSSKEDDEMPYDPDNPPEKLHNMPEHAQRIWVEAYNSASEKYDDEGRCHQIAYAAVKRAGYYQTEDGAWHKKEAEKQGEDEEEDTDGGCKSSAADNNLPDSAFLYVEPGGEKDAEGKTEPRSLRHLPYKKADGSIDEPRLRNALSRLGQPKTGTGEDKWLRESLRKTLVAKAQRLLESTKKAAPGRECICPECGAGTPAVDGTPCSEVACPECGSMMYSRGKPGASKSIGAIPWLRQKFEGVLNDLRALVSNGEATVQPVDDRRFVAFKTVQAKDGKPWLLTWTTNAFEDKDEECFSTKSIDEFVTRHEPDGKKGEFWFWHLPGAKMGDIRWQAMVGRFLVEMGPFDETPMGRKWAEFFSRHSAGHSSIAPDGWGTSHGYVYEAKDREDGVYDWFEKFETTVLPLSAASNQHTSMEVYAAMNDAQKSALELIGSELGVDDLVSMVIQTGEQRTKELEEQGTRFKAAAEEAPPAEAVPVVEPVEKARPAAEQETPVETKVAAEPVQAAAEKAEEAAEQPAEEGQGKKAILELAQQLSATMGLDTLTKTLQGLQSSVQAVASEQQAQAARLAKLEDVGVSPASPLIPLPRAAFWQASKLGQEPSDKSVAAAQPKVPDAIIEMAKGIQA